MTYLSGLMLGASLANMLRQTLGARDAGAFAAQGTRGGRVRTAQSGMFPSLSGALMGGLPTSLFGLPGRCGRSSCRDGRDCLAAAVSGKQYGRGGVHVCPRVLRAAPLSNTVSDGRICKCARSVPDAPAVCAHGACKRCLREHSADLSAGGRGAHSRARGGAGGDLCRGADSAAAGDARAEHTPVRA